MNSSILSLLTWARSPCILAQINDCWWQLLSCCLDNFLLKCYAALRCGNYFSLLLILNSFYFLFFDYDLLLFDGWCGNSSFTFGRISQVICNLNRNWLWFRTLSFSKVWNWSNFKNILWTLNLTANLLVLWTHNNSFRPLIWLTHICCANWLFNNLLSLSLNLSLTSSNILNNLFRFSFLSQNSCSSTLLINFLLPLNLFLLHHKLFLSKFSKLLLLNFILHLSPQFVLNLSLVGRFWYRRLHRLSRFLDGAGWLRWLHSWVLSYLGLICSWGWVRIDSLLSLRLIAWGQDGSLRCSSWSLLLSSNCRRWAISHDPTSHWTCRIPFARTQCPSCTLFCLGLSWLIQRLSLGVL